MSMPIDPKDQGSLKQLDDELEKYIKSAREGKEDKQALFKIAQDIKALAKNTNIPPNVRQSLQSVFQNLSSGKIGEATLSSIISAKMSIDEAIGPGKNKEEKK